MTRISKNVLQISSIGFLGLGIAFLAAGCATGRNYDADINALNSKVTALQGELQAKDTELERLQNNMKEEQAALQQAENEKKFLSEKLDHALTQLEAKSSPVSEKPSQQPIVDSDLK